MGNQLARLARSAGGLRRSSWRECARQRPRRDEKLVDDASPTRRIAGWENQHKPVSDFYRRLLVEVYRMTADELGIADEPAASPRPPGRAGADGAARVLTPRRRPPDTAVRADAEHPPARPPTRRATIYRQAAAHVDTLDRLVHNALPGVRREAAAGELSQAAALASWQALDMGQTGEAWRLHETAVAAGRESGQVAALAYARAQQAYILLDAGELDVAHTLVQAGQHDAGRRDTALRALDAAIEVLPDNAENDALPYLMLDAHHLGR